MIEAYFGEIETTISALRIVDAYSLTKKVYSEKQGFIKGMIRFVDDSTLEFTEVKDIDRDQKIKYRYHYMNQKRELIFRYDNAPHHAGLATFPHHKHGVSQVVASNEPNLSDVLQEIREFIKRS